MFSKDEESRVTTSCPGFASYEVSASGTVSVNGRIPSFATGSADFLKLKVAWDRFQGPVARTSRLTGVPAPWLMGVMVAESGGNPRACSPCSICASSLCEQAAGMSCCAFGLMQFIGQTARAYGTTPTEIVNNPTKAIEVAGELLGDFIDKFGFDLPRIAAAYNGGPGVLSKCGKEGSTFGWRTNGDYPMKVVRYANTAFAEGMTDARSTALPAILLAAVGAGIAWGIHTNRIRV